LCNIILVLTLAKLTVGGGIPTVTLYAGACQSSNCYQADSSLCAGSSLQEIHNNQVFVGGSTITPTCIRNGVIQVDAGCSGNDQITISGKFSAQSSDCGTTATNCQLTCGPQCARFASIETNSDGSVILPPKPDPVVLTCPAGEYVNVVAATYGYFTPSDTGCTPSCTFSDADDDLATLLNNVCASATGTCSVTEELLDDLVDAIEKADPGRRRRGGVPAQCDLATVLTDIFTNGIGGFQLGVSYNCESTAPTTTNTDNTDGLNTKENAATVNTNSPVFIGTTAGVAGGVVAAAAAIATVLHIRRRRAGNPEATELLPH